MTRHRWLARVDLEAASPLSIGNGEASVHTDVSLVRDAFGLPTLPGSALAGVLRRIVLRAEGETTAGRLFGRARGAAGDGREASTVTPSWGAIHDCRGVPVDGPVERVDAAALARDPILGPALETAPMRRDHVRLDHRGVAADRAKFDRAALPRGHRFTMDVAILLAGPDDDADAIVRAALRDPWLAIGGGARRGYGRLRCVRLSELRLDLARADDRATFAAWPGRLDAPLPEAVITTDFENRDEGGVAIALTPFDFWRIGGGKAPARATGADKPPHLFPLTERAVVWDQAGRSGRIEETPRFVVPATAIKGALRHRTVFHYHLIKHREALAGGAATSDHVVMREAPTLAQMRPQAVDALFGYVHEPDEREAKDRGGEDPVAAIGRVLIDDVVIADDDIATGVLWHNGIDRFTGGVLPGILYGEELAWRGKLPVRLRLDDARDVDAAARRAFVEALRDLVEGRLALGAGANKGHGFMTGEASHLEPLAGWVETGEAVG
ncbi:RAMP superfamily CRISPR-associated protein [Salinarimonas chemoclinalis]|uniref:RAMP superfamily CRISPR-associated protein n=1 Tax=Salinarimonas chemoclinalis TaxID=3241599 RepID=UPI00355648C3